MAKKKNKLPKSLTTVTPLSKFLAFSLFIIIPIIAFKLGADFQELRTELENRGACEILQDSEYENPSMMEF